ncbi:MAG: 16S rRNA (guanine(527)-N(7))-methyltransferase RsmG [Tepidisphaeraceae bacterium]
MTRTELWDRVAGTTLTDRQHELLHGFLDRLIETNQHINLTRIVDRADGEVRHIADALSVLKFIAFEDATRIRSVADVGTGGGVPGVPLAIARPNWRVTLIDSTKKKLDAVMAIVSGLGITNVEAVHTRIEAHERKYDLIVARAVADLDRLVQWCQPLMHAKSTLLALKGPKAQEELDAARATLNRHRLRATIQDVDCPELTGHVAIRVIRSGATS